MMRRVLILAALAALGACGGTSDPASEAKAVASQEAAFDPAALSEREDPAKVLAYLAAAAGEGKWDEAAKAWRQDAGMTGAKLKELIGGGDKPILAFGNAEAEGAAGSIYYEPEMTAIGEDGQVLRDGKITLKRVNDVPGAADWQLAWHIEQIEWAD